MSGQRILLGRQHSNQPADVPPLGFGKPCLALRPVSLPEPEANASGFFVLGVQNAGAKCGAFGARPPSIGGAFRSTRPRDPKGQPRNRSGSRTGTLQNLSAKAA